MPDFAALVTALILDRPLCDDCLASKSGLGPVELEATLAAIRPVLKLHEGEGRCRACGESAPVLSLERPRG
jgi:hypothetical protein